MYTCTSTVFQGCRHSFESVKLARPMSDSELSQGEVGNGAGLRNYLARTQTIQKLSEFQRIKNLKTLLSLWKIDGCRVVVFLIYYLVVLFFFLAALLDAAQV